MIILSMITSYFIVFFCLFFQASNMVFRATLLNKKNFSAFSKCYRNAAIDITYPEITSVPPKSGLGKDHLLHTLFWIHFFHWELLAFQIISISWKPCTECLVWKMGPKTFEIALIMVVLAELLNKTKPHYRPWSFKPVINITGCDYRFFPCNLFLVVYNL